MSTSQYVVLSFLPVFLKLSVLPVFLKLSVWPVLLKLSVWPVLLKLSVWPVCGDWSVTVLELFLMCHHTRHNHISAAMSFLHNLDSFFIFNWRVDEDKLGLQLAYWN